MSYGTFSVVAFGPVVAGPGLPEDEVVRPENAAEGAGPDGVHRARLQVQEDRSGDVFST